MKTRLISGLIGFKQISLEGINANISQNIPSGGFCLFLFFLHNHYPTCFRWVLSI